MREYLFRGLETQYNQYVYGSLLVARCWANDECLETYDEASIVSIDSGKQWEVLPETVGMKVAESNGENFFENQKVIVGDDDYDPFIAMIKWCDKCNSVQLFTENGEDCYNHKLYEMHWECFIQYCIDGLVRSAE